MTKRKNREDELRPIKRQKKKVSLNDRVWIYVCSIHENDRDVCMIYDCCGGNHHVRNENIKEYLL